MYFNQDMRFLAMIDQGVYEDNIDELEDINGDLRDRYNRSHSPAMHTGEQPHRSSIEETTTLEQLQELGAQIGADQQVNIRSSAQ